ncbi:MAG: triose-phosphate isomerase [Desulfobacterota bacterium]|nr:triose-phosphate isomerase [Thermodesulfobacteriota bacterium]
MRTPVIAGNWKMHNTIAESRSLVRELKQLIHDVTDVEVIVAPVFTSIGAVVAEVQGSSIKVAAQNMHWEMQGAYTGEVSPRMVKDAGCSHVIIGHSERRQYFAETNQTVNKKVRAALAAGLTPIMCIGETLAEREAGTTMQVVAEQVREGFAGMQATDISCCIIAYEPVWAIGTGKTATPAQAEEVHQAIRGIIAEIGSSSVAASMRILYGGSVKPDNIDELMREPDIDGALVGGASLKADSFFRIVRFQR